MELLDLPQLAGRSGIPVSLARYYRDRFVLFVPSVRIGRTLLHPTEAVDVVVRIHALAGNGASADAITQALEVESPVAVISAQPLQGISVPGAAGVMNALAATLDERGARIERELAAIRELAVKSTMAAVPAPGSNGTMAAAAEAIEAMRGELGRLRTGVDHLQAQTGQLASRDQLEWIGDVISAALIRLPKPSPEPSLEQRLEELIQEVRRPRPSSDAAELRVAVERLTEYVHHRDAELRRSFQTLVAALRSEIQALRAGLGDPRHAAPAQTPRPNGVVGYVQSAAEAAPDVDEPVGEHWPSRAPRRLGHPARPEGSYGDSEQIHGTASS